MVVLWTDGHAERTNRRKWDRYPPDGRTSVRLAAGGRAVDGELLDLSLGGARIRLAGELPEDRDLILQHRLGGIFLASQMWRRGDEMGVRFRVQEQTREHALQCATMLLYADDDELPEPPAMRRTGGARAAR